MGKKIDAFVLTLAAACGFYIYFRGAFQSRIAALILALVRCFALVKLTRLLLAIFAKGRFMQKRRVKRCAGGAVMELACRDADDARESLVSLLRASYASECPDALPVELIQLHPSTKLPQDRLFDAWRKHLGQERLAVCCTCPADADCRILAASLHAPKVALVDSGTLSRLIAERPDGFLCRDAAPAKRARLRLRRVASLLINRRNAPRGLLFTLAMILMYVLSANVIYLAAAMVLLFLVLVSFHQAPRPAKLF